MYMYICTCAHTQGITTLVNSQLLSVYRSVLYHVRIVSLRGGVSASARSNHDLIQHTARLPRPSCVPSGVPMLLHMCV